MKSFRNPNTNVLTAWGYVDHNGDDTARDEEEDFRLEPGKWQLVGEVWQPYTAPAYVPQQVTMRQARMALLRDGLLQTVNNAVANMTGDQGTAAQIEWDYSSTVERDRPLVQALAAQLGLTSAQLDALFILASTL